MLYWRQGYSGASRRERRVLVEGELKAKRLFLEKVVGYLCELSDSGLADCADLKARCRLSQWARGEGVLLACYRCTVNRPGVTGGFNWRLPYVRSSRR